MKGQLEYIKKKERRRRLLTQKGIKQVCKHGQNAESVHQTIFFCNVCLPYLLTLSVSQAEKFYRYTLKHGYGKDQDREMWKTLSRLQSEKPSASQRPHRIE